MSRLVETTLSVNSPPVYDIQTHQQKLVETNETLTVYAGKNLVAVGFVRLLSVVLSSLTIQPGI